MFIHVNGVRLFYEKQGTGKPLILLHGNEEDHRIFDEAIELLKKHYTVYAVDSRGHGQSDKVLEYHYLDMAKDIQEMIEQLELKDISLMGSSDGAIIGLLIGSLYPKLVDHLILAGVNVKPNGVILEVYQEMKEQYQKTKNPLIRMMLEAMYEEYFENTSHGFRPRRSCHTALIQVQKNFTATKWFVEGDIEGFFDNINHDVLIGILKERIADERFIRLIRKFLKAGYIEDWVFHKTYSGTPQGGIISPILANIYLDKLDKYMKEYAEKFDKGIKRKMNPEYKRYSGKIWWLGTKLKKTENEVTRKELITAIRCIQKKRLIPSVDEMDENYKRIKYVRYADDFIIGVIGSKADSETIKEDIKNFLYDKLKLTLSEKKTLITHGNKHAKFLGYEIYVRKFSDMTKRGEKSGNLIKVYGKKVVLEMPMEAMKKKLLYYEVMRIHQIENKEKWKPISRSKVLHNDDLEILDAYNAEIGGFTNYYSIANNSSHLNSFKYIMQYSMYKTFAKKYRISVRRIIAKYRYNKDFAVFYENKKGERKMRVFFNGSFKRKTTATVSNCDNLANTIYNTAYTSLTERLKASKCELCGSEGNIEIHHVKKLKDLKGKKPWEIQMIGRRRKTLAVCIPCHKKIHHGG